MALRVSMLLHKSVEHDSRVRRSAGALASAGHRVSVIELDARAAGTLDGFRRVSAVPPGRLKELLPFQAYRIAFLAWFVGRLLQERPDVIHAHDAAMLLPGLVGARLTNAQLVYDSHELATGVPYRDGRWARFVADVERLAVPRCAAVITVSDGIAARLQARYGLSEPPVVIRNVSDLRPPVGATGALRRALRVGAAPVILHQGAPAPDRGGEVLIRALARLPDAQLVFLGTSPFPGYEDRLRALAVREGAGERVHILRSVGLGGLLEWTADADVGVSLLQDTCENHRLALPNKVFEYLLAGVPMVVSDLPELAALVDRHGVGFKVRPDDPGAVADGIRTALAAGRDPALRARIAEAAGELHWSHERRRLEALYERLAPAPARRALILVRNTVTHDARVHRQVETLTGSGWEAVVLGVVSDRVPQRRAVVGTSPLLRCHPRSPFARWRPGRAGAPAAASPTTAPGPAAARPSRARRALLRLHRAFTAADFYRQGYGAVRALEPSLVHCNDWNTMWIGVAAKLTRGTRVVYDSHELWPDRNGRPEARSWLLACEALFVRVADEVITTSPGYADAIARRHRVRRPVVIRNVPHAPVPEAPHAGAGRPHKVLAYAGGLVPGRGLEQAIDALPRLRDVRLRLMGPAAPAYRDELESRARAAGVVGRVEFVPPVPPGGVVAALRDADAGLCLIQPVCLSYRLTLPNKLFEYAAAGLPVLVSDLPVMAAVVRDYDAGEVVAPSDLEAIVSAIVRLLEPDRLERYRRGARAIARDHGWEAERRRMSEVYERCASGA